MKREKPPIDDGDDSDRMTKCESCDLQFQVIFCADAWTQAGRRVVNHCPRCGDSLYDDDEEW
jgi:uncharacterized paraquat-inducible protein A